MPDSGNGHSIPVTLPSIHFGGKEHIIRTGCGSVSVTVYGDHQKSPLITYPDLALNHMSCFQRLFASPESASLLLHNFCVYHISPPGHELGAASIGIDDHVPSVEDLCDQILVVLNYFRLGSVMCMGAMAGAYILTLFSIKYSERVTSLILISPLCRRPSWNEWFYNKEVCGNVDVPESDIVVACRKLLDERDGINVWRYLQAIDRRPDITEKLKSLECKTIIFVGDSSPFHDEALHMTETLGENCSTLVEVHACGSMVTQEQPHAMLIPLEYFLKGFGLYRPCRYSNSPRSPLGPSCINPELLYPENMGLKLKPIILQASPPQPCAHDPLLKPNHANVMEVPGSCKIRVLPKAAPSDFIIKNGKLAMEIPCGQKLIQTQRASTGKSFRSNPFLGSNKEKKGYVSDPARQSTLRGHGMSHFLVKISAVMSLLDFPVEIREKSIQFLMEMEFCEFSPELEDHFEIFEHISHPT